MGTHWKFTQHSSVPGSERWPRLWGAAKGQVWFLSKLGTIVNALTGNAHTLTSCKTEGTLSYTAWAREFRSLKHAQTITCKHWKTSKNKASVLSSSTDTRGLNPKINSPCYVCKAERKTQLFMFHNHPAPYSLLTLCREGNGCVSKAEFSSSLKDAGKKYKILN